MSKSTLTIRSGKPAFRIKLGREMSINKKVLYALGNPVNINFWWSESQRVMLISGATEKSPLSFSISDRFYTTKSGFKIEKSKFMQTIMKIADWRRDMIYTVTGEYLPELGMVAFKLDDAEEIEIKPEQEADSDV